MAYNIAEFKTWRANQGLEFYTWESFFGSHGNNWVTKFREHYQNNPNATEHLASLEEWIGEVDQRERERESLPIMPSTKVMA